MSISPQFSLKRERAKLTHLWVMIDVSADPGSRAWKGVRPSAEKTGQFHPGVLHLV